MKKLILDVGSNAMKGTLFDDHSGEIIQNWRIVTEIGRHILPDGAISDDAIQTTIDAANRICAEAACTANTDISMHAIGTEALRKASNKLDIQRLFLEKTSGPLDIISGDEEARLERIAVMHSDIVLKHPGCPFFHIDSGGSSTECSIISASGEPLFSHSFAFGRHAILEARPARPDEMTNLLNALAENSKIYRPQFAVMAGSSIISYAEYALGGKNFDQPFEAGANIPSDDLGAQIGSIIVAGIREITSVPLYATQSGVRHGWIASHLIKDAV